MKEYKFDIGDKVKLKRNLKVNKRYGGITLSSKMWKKHNRGRVFTIINRITDTEGYKGYVLDTEDIYFWDESMLRYAEGSSEADSPPLIP